MTRAACSGRIGPVHVLVLAGLLLSPIAEVGGQAREQDQAEPASQPMIGAAAPAFDLETLGGDTLSLQDLRGRYVVIHFGASW